MSILHQGGDFSPDFSAVTSPEALKQLPLADLPAFCAYLREYILTSVSDSGGHLSSNLGSIELTVALHYLLDSPHDRILWDVGHQCYAHKILTGRKERMSTIRQTGGLGGFPKRDESVHDHYNTGHAGTSLSQALGEAIAKQLNHQTQQTIAAVIGDASIVTGMAFEAMNHAGYLKAPFLVILNDNEMSISKNVGAISYHLTHLINSSAYKTSKRGFINFIKKIPLIGNAINRLAKRFRMTMKSMATDHQFFGELGFRYLGPIDGHDVTRIIYTLKKLLPIEEPILLHLVTRKGKGYDKAESDPIKYHGVPKFDVKSGIAPAETSKVGLSHFVGETLTALGAKDEKLVVITPAMKEGSGLVKFAECYPERFFDTGIAEQHAATFAGALASRGLVPFFCIYSTFLQRGYDQFIQDIALMNLPVRLVIDRAGCVGQDGETHHGFYDIAFMSTIPQIKILSARNAAELVKMLSYMRTYAAGPIAVRFSKMENTLFSVDEYIQKNKFFTKPATPAPELLANGSDILILTEGVFAERALLVRDILTKRKISVAVVDVQVIKPLPINELRKFFHKKQLIVTLENHARIGGFGHQFLAHLNEKNLAKIPVLNLGWPDAIVEHGAIADMEKIHGLSTDQIARTILSHSVHRR